MPKAPDNSGIITAGAEYRDDFLQEHLLRTRVQGTCGKFIECVEKVI
jgi:hypothetical protein